MFNDLKPMPVQLGLYRHFKGGYYYVTGLSKNATDESTIMVNYFDVCHPEYGSYVRPLDDFITEQDGGQFISDTEIKYIKDRKDNITGQHKRFERVRDLNFQLGSVSTEQLIEEFRKREDSPLQALDIDGLNDKVLYTDYIVGVYHNNPEFCVGVESIVVLDTEEQAKNYLESHKTRKDTGIYKRTFIKLH